MVFFTALYNSYRCLACVLSSDGVPPLMPSHCIPISGADDALVLLSASCRRACSAAPALPAAAALVLCYGSPFFLFPPAIEIQYAPDLSLAPPLLTLSSSSVIHWPLRVCFLSRAVTGAVVLKQIAHRIDVQGQTASGRIRKLPDLHEISQLRPTWHHWPNSEIRRSAIDSNSK